MCLKLLYAPMTLVDLNCIAATKINEGLQGSQHFALGPAE